MSTALVTLVLTIVTGHGELSQREQRMTQTACTAEIKAAHAVGGVVFAACVPVPSSKKESK